MKLFRKLRSKRGMTLIEVLMVVVLMTIMLGIAMPNLLAESEVIKMTELNSNARAVAVAVQSKLYGMKSAGTAKNSSYYLLNEEAAVSNYLGEGDDPEPVLVVSNFGEKKDAGRQYLLSGAITDTELMNEGYIAVVYKKTTADVLAVFYSENEFSLDDVLPVYNESTLKSKKIGLYLGEGAPAPERAISIPRFKVSIQEESEELFLQMEMQGTPDPSIADLPLGLEIYIQFPDFDDKEKWDEILVYAEGMFDSKYTTLVAGSIAPDDAYQLTLRKIAGNQNIMRFIIDSAVLEKSANAKDFLKHNVRPDIVSVASAPFYPRATIDDWMMQSSNPYITYWFRQHAVLGEGPSKDDPTISEKLYNKILNSTQATDYIPIDGTCRVRMELHVLSGETWKEGTMAGIRKYDEKYAPVSVTSEEASPYFSSLAAEVGTGRWNQVALNTMRALSHLWQVFESTNEIEEANLYADINGDNFYNLLHGLRGDLWKKLNITDGEAQQNLWGDWAVNQGASVKSCDGNKKFTLDGITADGGSYKIQNIIFTGRNGGDASSEPGGLFEYANGCTFKNIDIVNPATLRRNYDPTFLKTENHSITAINESEQWGGASGALVGFAVNCNFENVRAYLDNAHHPPALNPADLTIDGSVVGGLVGVAIGSGGGKTEFTNCAASVRATNGTLDSALRVVYAGGLVGIAAGNVTISSCYAASQLSGYYSGGLVGATVSGQGNAIPWTYKDRKGDSKPREQGSITDTPTIKSSFAAGQITRQVRVGGGLIADVQGSLPQEKVQNCYSAAWWEALAPVSYGTFKGDKKNYYVYQTRFPIPVTENVEAWFKCTGDVLSLKTNEDGTDVDDGVACTGGDLKSKTEFLGWTAEATATHQWSYNEGSFELHKMYWEKKNTPEAYPFPMPSEYADRYGAEFWGDWIKTYEEAATTAGGTRAATSFSSEFLGYYACYYDIQSVITTSSGQVRSRQDYYDYLTRYEEERKGDYLSGYRFQINTSGAAMLKLFDVYLSGDKLNYWWARNSDPGNQTEPKIDPGAPAGVAGTTKVGATSDGKFVFTAPKFYNPDYDPVTGYGLKVEGAGVNMDTTGIRLDYYGFYCYPHRGTWQDWMWTKYYIMLTDETIEGGTAELDDDKKIVARLDDDKKIVWMNRTEFEKAIPNEKIMLNEKDVNPEWSNGRFFISSAVVV